MTLVMQTTLLSATAALFLFNLLGCALNHDVSQHHPRMAPSASFHATSSPTDSMDGTTESPEPLAMDLRAMRRLDAIIPELARKRVVFVGESHDRYDHHLNQLEVLRRLHEKDPNLAIGVEWFQQPFQSYLDAFIKGDLDERALLSKTEYYRRWRFDYRLYQPIIRYARKHRIPLLALNVPAELTAKVGRNGLQSLTPEERAQLPDEIDDSDPAYRARVRTAFDLHPPGQRDFENFVTVQYLWDEGMAERAAEYLQANPDRKLVVFAGSGHIAYGSGIPRRLARRVPTDFAIVLSDANTSLDPEMGDYLLVSKEQRLPSAGRLGVLLDTEADGAVIRSLVEGGGARDAGLKEGDRISVLDGEVVRAYDDVKMLLFDKVPGEVVSLRVLRRHWLSGEQEHDFEVVLR